MRDAYHEELDSIGDSLVEMARLVGSAIGRATTAILDADLKLAESVIEADARVDELQHDLEGRAIALLARQQPVATDLRIVVTSLRMSAERAMKRETGARALRAVCEEIMLDIMFELPEQQSGHYVVDEAVVEGRSGVFAAGPVKKRKSA